MRCNIIPVNARQRSPLGLLAGRRAADYALAMHMIIIAWLYVAGLVAATEPSVVGAVLSFFFYGLVPVAIIAYIGTSRRRRESIRMRERSDDDHRGDPQRDQ